MIKVILIGLLFVSSHVLADNKLSGKTGKSHESSKSKENHDTKHDKIEDFLEKNVNINQ